MRMFAKSWDWYCQRCGLLLATTTVIAKQPREPQLQERRQFAYLTMKNKSIRTCEFHICSFRSRSRPISDVKWPVLQLYGYWWREQDLRTNFDFLFPSPTRSHQLNSRRVGKHFSSQTTWNYRGMITETQILSFFFTSRRHRCCP